MYFKNFFLLFFLLVYFPSYAGWKINICGIKASYHNKGKEPVLTVKTKDVLKTAAVLGTAIATGGTSLALMAPVAVGVGGECVDKVCHNERITFEDVVVGGLKGGAACLCVNVLPGVTPANVVVQGGACGGAAVGVGAVFNDEKKEDKGPRFVPAPGYPKSKEEEIEESFQQNRPKMEREEFEEFRNYSSAQLEASISGFYEQMKISNAQEKTENLRVKTDSLKLKTDKAIKELGKYYPGIDTMRSKLDSSDVQSYAEELGLQDDPIVFDTAFFMAGSIAKFGAKGVMSLYLALEEYGPIALKYSQEIMSSKGVTESIKRAIQVTKETIGRVLADETGSISLGGTHNSVGTIWSRMMEKGDLIPGTQVPKWFNLKVGEMAFHIHPNATKHLAEHIVKNSQGVNIALKSQLLLEKAEAAITKAVTSGRWTESLEKGSTLTIDGVEMIFSKKPTDTLPILKHIVFKQI